MQRGGRVEADHEVELLGAEYVEVRRGPQPAVDVAPAGDRDRLVEPGDRARRRHGVGQVGRRRVVAPERDASSRRIVTRDHPEALVVGPPARHHAPEAHPRPRARRWSQAIYAVYADAAGLWYASSMHANAPAVALYERGIHLSRFCHARLEEAERRIEILSERGDVRPAPASLAAGDEPDRG